MATIWLGECVWEYVYLPHLLHLNLYITRKVNNDEHTIFLFKLPIVRKLLKLMFIFEIVSDRIIDLTIFIEFEHHLQCDIGMTWCDTNEIPFDGLERKFD